MKVFVECVFGVLLVVVPIALFCTGAALGHASMNLELQQRGLKEYDRATGRLIWTEKAGGEKGGDK